MYCMGHQVSFIVPLLAGLALALPHALDPRVKTARSTDTCADPSLANTVFEAFDAAGTTHVLRYLQSLVNTDTVNGALTFTNELPTFKAWPSEQDFLSPLFQLRGITTGQVIYAVGANATSPPIISGFGSASISAWVYSTQVCDSVPLMSATLALATDAYYTIDQSVHDGLVAAGWHDDGVVAFVLPLYNS